MDKYYELCERVTGLLGQLLDEINFENTQLQNLVEDLYNDCVKELE